MVKTNLTFSEQINLFKSRGIIIDDIALSSKKIEDISYYKLKEYASSFITGYDSKGSPIYEPVKFDVILERYYKDKNLRIHLFHAIEKIEVSFKTRIAYNLGNLDAYGYLETNKWIDKTDKNKYGKRKKEFESIFEKHSKYDFYKSSVDTVNGMYSISAPNVWLFINSLNFSECLKIYKIMSNSRKVEIANHYNTTTKELSSWMEVLKLVRNLCAHNGSIIDFKLKSRPILKHDWNNICCYKSTSDLALLLCISKNLIDVINSRYKWKFIRENILSLTGGSDLRANHLGFKDRQAIFKLLGCSKRQQKNYRKKEG